MKKSRSGRNIIDQFPEFQDGKFLRVQNAIIDCELVCLDKAGKPVFSDIISRMHRIGKTSIQNAIKSKPIKESVEEEKRTTWIIPQFLCEVEFASFASTGTLREPVFLKMWNKY